MGYLNLKNKRILVTGGSGYLGTYLVSALNEAGADVYIIDNDKSDAKNKYCLDITNFTAINNAVKEIQPQIIYHLAALLNRDRDFINHDKILSVNYNGTINLLNALKDIEYENLIFSSTSEIYGNNNTPFNEMMIPAPVSPYSLSKLFAEHAISTFSEIYNKNYTIFRLFNFFGTNMPQNFFIPQMINSLKHESNFKMTKGKQRRDFLFIDDVISAFFLAINNENAYKEIFNVCSGKSITIKNFAIKCNKILNNRCKIEFGALPYRENEIWNMIGDNSKIKNKIGFKPIYNINKIITELLLDK